MQKPTLDGFTKEEKVYILAYLDHVKASNNPQASELHANAFLEKYKAKFPEIKEVLNGQYKDTGQ